MIEKICFDNLNRKKFVRRNPKANVLGMGVKCLVQYRSNPEKGSSMFYIPEGTKKFNVSIKKYGATRNYAIEARDSGGNTLNTFYFLA